MIDFNTAKNLDELLEMVNNNEIAEGVLCELPTFGGEAPSDEVICETFSWDETRFLQQNTCVGNRFELVERY